MAKKLWGDPYRNILVCIDRCEGDIPEGRLFSPALKQPVPFGCVMSFVNEVEALLNDMDFPQSFVPVRSFSGKKKAAAHARQMVAGEGKGQLATFRLRVLFRQNASWQGSLNWLDQGQEESFRSTLELLYLMQSAWREAAGRGQDE